LLRGDPPTAGDLANRSSGAHRAASDTPVVDHQLCGKVSFPKGKRPGPLTIYFWPADPDALPFPSENVNSDGDGSFCASLDPGKYLIQAIEDPGNTKERHTGYFPGVKDRTSAQPVLVNDDGSTVHVSFTVMRQALYRVRGYVRGVDEAQNDSVE